MIASVLSTLRWATSEHLASLDTRGGRVVRVDGKEGIGVKISTDLVK